MEYLPLIIELFVAVGSVVGVIVTAKSNFNKITTELDKRIELLKANDKANNDALTKDIARLNLEISNINNELKKTNDTVITITKLEGRINLLEMEIKNLKGGK